MTRIYSLISTYVYGVGRSCNQNIIPLIVDNEVSAPYTIYKRNEQLPNYNKDGVGYYTANYTVKFVASTYADSLKMLEDFSSSLYIGKTEYSTPSDKEGHKLTLIVDDVTSTDGGEDWIEGYFIQQIELSITYSFLDELIEGNNEEP